MPFSKNFICTISVTFSYAKAIYICKISEIQSGENEVGKN